MTLPATLPLRGGELIVWRLDDARFASSWDSGEGAFRFGGRWNSKGVRAVYCSTDPGTAILEVAVHKGFQTLDGVRHMLTEISIEEPDSVRSVAVGEIPNPNWLQPGMPGAGQREFGDALLHGHKFVLIPSVVSPQSWSLIFIAAVAAGAYSVRSQRVFALDTRLNPAS